MIEDMKQANFDFELAAAITKTASQQTYYTIQFLVDPGRVADAYRAYGYFRWVDDILDAESGSRSGRSDFIRSQKSLLERGYCGQFPQSASPEEMMLVKLIQHDTEKSSGLQLYLRNMMAVMTFDAERRGRVISQTELKSYTYYLASAVTEALHYFIGHDSAPLHDGTRYLAVSAAHVTHMLRDTFDDLQAGYFNIPREALERLHIRPQDVQSDVYRSWVKRRVRLARAYFKAGRDYLHRVENRRCRLAGFAYTARFEWLLNTIENEGYCLRPHYDERKTFQIGLQMSWLALSSLLKFRRVGVSP
jgi:phytoene/squalene synthetase